MRTQVEPILARLQPVNSTVIMGKSVEYLVEASATEAETLSASSCKSEEN